ncbi:MAG: hypothetical protein HC851_09340 [Acaryochloris sp. RU_4_1]|nr:hypothetical protein [Acaryochloris sp. RU_4_1]
MQGLTQQIKPGKLIDSSRWPRTFRIKIRTRHRQPDYITMDIADYKLPQTTRATSLDDIDYTLSPQSLINPAALDAFYQDELNAIRGGDKVGSVFDCSCLC